MSRRAYPQYSQPSQSGPSYPPTTGSYPGQNPDHSGQHYNPGPSLVQGGNLGGVPDSLHTKSVVQGHAGGPPGGLGRLPPGQGIPLVQGSSGVGMQPAVGPMTNQVEQINLGPSAPHQPPIPTATPLSSVYPQSSHNVAQFPATVAPLPTAPPHNVAQFPAAVAPLPTAQPHLGATQPIGTAVPSRNPASNIGPPPQPGQVYQALVNPPPPVMSGSGVQYRPPVSGVQSQPPGSGVQSQPPGSGVQSQPPGSGVQYRPPVSGVQSQPPGSGMPYRLQTQPPTSVVLSRPPSSGVLSRPPMSGVHYKGPTSTQAPPIISSAPPTTGMPTSAMSTAPPTLPAAPPTGYTSSFPQPHPPGPTALPGARMGTPPTGLGAPQQTGGAPPTGRASHPLSGQPGLTGPGLPGSVGGVPGQPSTGLAAGPGPVGGVPGQPQPGLGQGPTGMMPPPNMPSGGSAEGFNTTDPFLQPVNLLEQRNILPPEPLEPPPIVLPNGQSRYAPSHRVFCCTMNAVPATSSLLSKLKLPLAIHIHPYKDMSAKDCPVIHPSIIIRCRSCRAYINPYVTFIDSRHWRCNLCFRANTLPEDYDFNPNSGHHGDRSHRSELKKPCIEYIAPSEYMVRPPQPCVYYFVVDVSFTSIESGVLAVFCRCLLEHIDRLPGDARTLVGLLTFDSSLHFYSFPSTDSQPQMLVVSDVEDIFLPSPESLLVNLRQYKEIFRSLLEDLPRVFATNPTDKSALGPALQAATKLLHPIGGRITVIQCALPNIGAGALKYRDVSPSSTKMPTLKMAPASDFYKSLALDCNTQQIAIDIFGFSGQFMDLATMSCAAKFSSGQAFHYSDFHHSRQVARERFEKDFRRYLTRKVGFEAVMRVRCTEGMSLHTFHGNFFVRSTDLLSLPCVNPDLGYTINISIDDDLKEYGSVCFQAALLYTSSRGERRIRVHTLCVPVSTQLAHIYARLNVLAITGTLANMGVDRATNATLGDAREALMNTVIDSGKVYRASLASSRQASQFALPASIKLLPLFVIALLKSSAFSLSSKVSYDRRTQAMNQIKCMPLDYFLHLLYPRLYAVHMLTENDVVETDGGGEELRPPILQLSAEKLNRYGVYLMDYGLGLYLWVCKDASQEYLTKTLDVKHFGAIPETMCELPSLKNDCSKLLCKLVRQIRSSRQYILPFQVIREDGPHRLLFIEKLVDDRTEMGTSYYELLSHIARQQNK